MYTYNVRLTPLARPASDRHPHRKEPMMLTSMATKDRKMILSTSWIFVTLNYLYADVLVLMEGVAPTAPKEVELVSAILSPGMLLVVAIFLELAMVMVVLSRLLEYGINRWANVIIATLHTAGVLASLFVGTSTINYIFFVAVEVTTLLFIIRYAWSWKNPAGSAA
jgi:hypothetical protein